jgi:ribonuclease HI
MTTWILNFDGSCEPRNPGGWMVWAWVLTGCGEDRWGSDHRKPHRENTNNLCEYYALGVGVKAVRELMAGNEKPDLLLIRGDSQLVIHQLRDEWDCNSVKLRECLTKILGLLGELGIPWEAEWVPREQNTRADAIGREHYREITGSTMRVR